MEFRLLGPVEVWDQGRQVEAGSPRQRCVLAALAFDAGRLVPTDVLIDRVWGEAPPQRARQALHVYLSGIRAMLRRRASEHQAALISRSGGYLLDVSADSVDVYRFRQLIDHALKSQSDAQRVALLKQSLDLWRGNPLGAIPGDWAIRIGHSWREQHLDAVVALSQAHLRLGNPATVIAPLTEVIAEHPLAELPVLTLMLAYQSLGRSAPALEQYAAIRRRLSNELGTDPMPELQQLQQSILRGEPGAGMPSARPVPANPVPAQLPADVPGFVGRKKEIDRLDAVATTVCVVTGTAGVGKTALAVHWAHRHAARFVDGQLFANLRGFDPVAPLVAPIEVLGRFLRGLGVQANAIPRDLEEAAGLYRSLLASRRILVVLDNARDVEQVRPLLPGSRSCHVLVTSRHRLGGLVARDGAEGILVESLEPERAASLLRHLLSNRVESDSGSIAELARRCAYLPLALRVAAANLASRPHVTMEEFIGRLDKEGPLSLLQTEGDEHSAVATAFSVSFAGLSSVAQSVFRHSSLVPGPDFEAASMAAMTASTLDAARSAIGELCSAHLLDEDEHQRFSTHDLLRAYAATRAHNDLTQEMSAQSLRRMVDFYTDVAHEAALLVQPRRNTTPWEISYAPAQPLRFTGREEALSWFDREVDNLIGVLELASARGWHNPAWRLAEMLFPFLTVRRLWREWLHINSVGLASAQAAGDQEGVARLHICLGAVYKQTGDYANARSHWTAALTAAQAIAHRRLTTACRVNLGGLCVNEGDPASGAGHLELAMADEEYAGDPGYGVVLHINYGCALLDMGDLARAAEIFRKALDMAVQGQDLQHTCHAHHNLAEIALRRKDPASALDHAEQELRLAAQIGDPLRQAAAKDMLASAWCFSDLRLAREQWEQAHSGYRELNHRRAEPLADWLGKLGKLDPADVPEADLMRREQARKMI